MHDLSVGAAVVALKSPLGGKSTAEVVAITGPPKGTVNGIYARAIERGFNPNLKPLVIEDEFFEDAFRSGRPSMQTETVKEALIQKVRREDKRRPLLILLVSLATSSISTSGTTI